MIAFLLFQTNPVIQQGQRSGSKPPKGDIFILIGKYPKTTGLLLLLTITAFILRNYTSESRLVSPWNRLTLEQFDVLAKEHPDSWVGYFASEVVTSGNAPDDIIEQYVREA